MSTETLDPDHLTDHVIDLYVKVKDPADPARGHVPQYHYKITLHGSEEEIGTIRLRIGDHPALLTAGHIGYFVAEGYRGRHFAERACRLLAPVALEHGMTTIILTCDPANAASRRTCERLGAHFAGIFGVPADHEMYQKGARMVCRYDWVLNTQS
jgi:tagatose 1,6-diphosphate aldolase